VRRRIECKITVLVYKALNDLSSQYLADDRQLITTTGCRRLRSSNVATCNIPKTWTTLGNRSFTAAGPRLWNSLPLHLRDCELSLLEFRRLLKVHLFGGRSQHLVTYSRYSALYKCTYLLTNSHKSKFNLLTIIFWWSKQRFDFVSFANSHDFPSLYNILLYF